MSKIPRDTRFRQITEELKPLLGDVHHNKEQIFKLIKEFEAERGDHHKFMLSLFK